MTQNGIYYTREQVLENLGYKEVVHTSTGSIRCRYKPDKDLLKTFRAYVAIQNDVSVQIITIEAIENEKNLAPLLKAYEVVLNQRDFILLKKKTI